MRSSDRRVDRLVEAALAEAVSVARWERIDLETRRPDSAHAELMLARAAELAMSPIARDQLMSLALERNGKGLPPEGLLLDEVPAARDRPLIADRIFGLGSHRAAETEALVQAVEARHAARLGEDACFKLLAQCLEQDATLQEALWDHPGIPAADAVRLAMLCSVPRFRARAEDLSLLGVGWWQRIQDRFTTRSKRGPR